jgi:hypothetical protein
VLDSGEPANALLPGVAPVEVSFSETMPAALRFDFEPGRRGGLQGFGTETLIRNVGRDFGTRGADEFGARARTLEDRSPDAAFDLFAGAACDAAGLAEVKAYYPLDPAPTPAVAAMKKELPGLRELMHSVSVRRGGLVAERVYLICTTDLELFSLEPLLARLALRHRLPELVVWLLRLTGGSFVLPPSSCVVGLRRLANSEVELKVEILTGRLPPADDPAAIAALLAERPAGQRAYRRWLDAIAVPHAGLAASVVSARLTASAPLSISVYAHPVVEQETMHERDLAVVLG